VAIELMMDTGRRPEETCELPWDCLERDKDGKYVLVYDNLKCQRRRRELPITDTTAALILDQQRRVRDRFPDAPLAGLKLLPAAKMNPLGTACAACAVPRPGSGSTASAHVPLRMSS
jgi:integrase